MGQIQSLDRSRRFLPALEGLRGYGFLLVFCGHYFLAGWLARPGTLEFKSLLALSSLGLFAVPAFFVLSGYLIGGILFETRNRAGYFKVFYSRRILRVFPVYYLTLLAIACFYLMRGVPMDRHFWVQFFYIQNLFPSYTGETHGLVFMGHFWSLAVEEQFYLVWPMIVWLFPERRTLIRITAALIGGSCVLRLLAPLIMSSSSQITSFTPTRVDAILLGVLLALVRRDAIYDRIERFAKWVVLAGSCTVMSLVYWLGKAWGESFTGREIFIPLVNITSAAVVVAVMEEGSLLNRGCSQRWACWLGSLSYSGYVFHFLFAPFFFDRVIPRLSMHMSPHMAVLASGALAFCLTMTLSILSYRFIEGPVINLKGKVKYGPKPIELKPEVGELVLAKTGT
jgi:peptidoglycan/LPS O-acetylase OafA/YrhL